MRLHNGLIVILILSSLLWGCSRKSGDEQRLLSSDIEAEDADVLTGQDLRREADSARREMELAEVGEEQKILAFDMTGYTGEGKKKWEITGQSADIVSDTVILNDIMANAYSEDRMVNLTASSGKYNKRENTIVLKEDVVITTSDNITLKADWFEWYSETNKIKTESFVEVTREDLYASGTGAEANTKDKKVKVDRDIKVQQGEIMITCRGPLVIDYEANKGSFNNEVTVTDPRGELRADRLDIIINPDTQKIEQVIAEGNVELRRDKDVASGQKVTYMVATGEALLTGSPEIHIYSRKGLDNALDGD